MGDLIVNAPKNMPDRKIFEFVKSREEWIRANQIAVTQNAYINRRVASYNAYYFLGREITPVISSTAKQITRQDNLLYIPSKIEPAKIQKRIEKFLKDNAKEIITARCEFFGATLRLGYTSIAINNNKTRWGSCTRGRALALNWRAVMLPPALLDYIVVHEFCHLLEFNHTPQFWAVVETILPNWRALRKELKHMGWLLQLFRNI